MNLKIHYANHKPDHDINGYIEEQLLSLNKYSSFHEHDRINVDIQIHKENACEIKIHIFLQHHHEIIASANNNDIKTSINQVIKKLVTQLKNLKDKRTANH